jgi:hypothetical protein
VEDVFGVLSNVETTPTWHHTAVSEYWTSEGPVGVGSTRMSIGKAHGIRTRNEAVVSVFDPHRALGLSSTSGAVPFEISILFAPEAGGTRVTWISDLKPTGVLKFILAITVREHDRIARMDELKRLMESGAL